MFFAFKRIFTFSCRFRYHRTFGYTCELHKVEAEIEFKIIGDHLRGKSDCDVTGLVFLRSRIATNSSLIFSKFPNLEYLDASESEIYTVD